MRRSVERFLEDPLAEELLRGNIKPNDIVEVHTEIDKLIFRAVQPDPNPQLHSLTPKTHNQINRLTYITPNLNNLFNSNLK